MQLLATHTPPDHVDRSFDEHRRQAELRDHNAALRDGHDDHAAQLICLGAERYWCWLTAIASEGPSARRRPRGRAAR